MSRSARTPRTPRRVELQTTRLEALDDSLGPLGPLGDNGASQPEPPTPPTKEQTLPSRIRPAASSLSSSMMDSVDLSDEIEHTGSRARQPPPVQPPPSGIENTRRQGQPSVSVEQAAKPSFEITVGDPHKVGDLTSSHIVYQVRTKVRSITSLRQLAPLTGLLDFVKSVQAVRVYSQPSLQRFFVALQFVTRQQPRRRGSSSSGEASRWSI
jgi:sorting nexin-1/2